jgi:hypothetical protein
MEFSKLKKACRYEKGGYCKLARDGCKPEVPSNNQAIIKSIKA